MLGVEGVRREVFEYFSSRLEDGGAIRPRLDGVNFKSLQSEDNVTLIANVSEEEIKEAVWSCGGDKSPGPDGFNFNFLKTSWNLIKGEVVAATQEFFTNNKMPRCVSSSFIALIPKKIHPQSLEDFWPISLIGCIHKIIAKVLSARIKKRF